MTTLTDMITQQIERSGPLTVAEYMTQCLLHPTHGYYTTQQPLGASGDFITAPEISQMFGEMIGLCLAQTWIDQGRPNPFTLAELGPGRGTLMADILRATKAVPEFHNAAKIILVEASPTLRKTQMITLEGNDVTWVNDATELPEMPIYLIANEFFDCLPIQQFIRTEHGWQEQMIGAQDGSLGFVLGAQKPVEVLGDAELGHVLETCPSAIAICSYLADRIEDHGGCALIFDYGDGAPKGDTLQALRNHKKVDPLNDCGLVDLTAHVNFNALSTAASAFAKVSDLTQQGVYLERMGITLRAQSLAEHLSGNSLENHISAHRRLTHPDEMGNLFKTLAIVPREAPLPPGFVS